MCEYTLTHLSDAVLLRDLRALLARERSTTAELLAHIAEVDLRKLYVPAGYPSMFEYCVGELYLSEDAAYRRITAARAARRFPALFEAVGEGRLHLAAVSRLASHVTPENVSELIEAATHRKKSDIDEMLARRFATPNAASRASVSTRIRPLPATTSTAQLGPGRVDIQDLPLLGGVDEPGSESVTKDEAPTHLESSTQVSAPPPDWFLMQARISKSTRDKLQYAQALLSHSEPTGDLDAVMDRALDLLIKHLERQKFGAVTRESRREAGKSDTRNDPLPQGGSSAGGRTERRERYVPARVRRAVWERDRGQCTFVSASGKRCEARRLLEFDHVEPVARGGTATVERMRLRCRAHNQYEAERVFGAEFMNGKRHTARTTREGVRARIAPD
jgi:hypothetical protein